MKSIKLWWWQLVNNKRVTLIQVILYPLSLIYRFVLVVRTCLYKSGIIKRTKLSCPVISIGNITVGGTGKTPMTEYLAKTFIGWDKRVVVLSRGYGKIDSRPSRDAVATFTDDEILVSHPSVQRLTGANRAKLGQTACQKHSPNVILLDDGFQHGRLQRDLDIVMIDCLNPFGNRCLFPAGILREPLDALNRASLFVLTHTDLVSPDKLSKIQNDLSRFGKPVVKSIHKAVAYIPYSELSTNKSVPLEALTDKKVWTFCGIGNPDSFGLMLEKAGVVLTGFTVFPDHYRYRKTDIVKLVKQAQQAGAECLVTTIKDAIKIPNPKSQIPIYALKIELVITEGKEKLEEMIKELPPKP